MIRRIFPHSPEKIFVPVGIIESLKGDLKYAAVRGALEDYSLGRLSPLDRMLLVNLVRKERHRVFENMNGYLPLYKFMTAERAINKREIDSLIDEVCDVECRVILLEYKRKFLLGLYE